MNNSKAIEHCTLSLSYLGYSSAEIEKKIGLLVKSCQTAFDAFIKSENALLTELHTKIESKRDAVAFFCNLLGLPPYFPPHGLNTCQLLKVCTSLILLLMQVEGCSFIILLTLGPDREGG